MKAEAGKSGPDGGGLGDDRSRSQRASPLLATGVLAAFALLLAVLFAGRPAGADGNPIEVETQQPGTTTWHLDQPADDGNQ